MQWWGWALVWIALSALATAYLGWRLWRLWPHLRDLGTEVATAQKLLDELDSREHRDPERQIESVDDLAVLQSPLALNEARLNARQRQRDARSARRVARTRQWMNDVE